MFSATCGILKGDHGHPDVFTTINYKVNEPPSILESTLRRDVKVIVAGSTEPMGTTHLISSSRTDALNQMSLFPIVSVFTEALRVLLSIVHMIVHIFLSIFDCSNREYHIKEAGFGATQFGIGLLGILPGIGNISSWIFHFTRTKSYEQMAQAHFENRTDLTYFPPGEYRFEYACGELQKCLRIMPTEGPVEQYPPLPEKENDTQTVF